MTKEDIYNKELNKLNEIFSDVDESNKKLVEGLIEDAAFLYSENYGLKQVLKKTGILKIHPNNPELQKQLPAAKEFRQNLNNYAVVIKTLGSVLQKKIENDDEDMDEFE